ncbi:DUF2939 domain-containing protein [Stenotrophomonas sp. SY1]|uniref:DUF2939 domain-containing protein n=1 Tax=Stenotrophomonas sp. SY1 TaxID=477235 RepID=UPI001E5CE77C|nr:DUF2939 domain-containing protein [Stenotrophomonas sp. SY1]MCD9086729.1 DUF2939 domain-containing protein [Stenotrophomonas sp. SY1]
MKKWIAAAIVLMVLSICGYVLAGPYLAIQGISSAIEQRDSAALTRHVDFPTLRVNLKAQLNDHLVRKAGADMQSSLLGAVILGVASNITDVSVDTLVTPVGVAAMLQGDGLIKRAVGDTVNGDTWGPPSPARPLADTSGRYDSLSRFTATSQLDDGRQVHFVLSRHGLRWQLTDIQLPLQQAP